ncbi:MAG TPA: SRPBCC family protein [Acidimicrobiales bacterium]
MQARTAITVNAPSQEVYARWRNFERLPEFMYHLESVKVTGENRSHWVAKAPGGTTVEWDAEITEDEPARRISWRSLEGADVQNSGTVGFRAAPKGQGTEVHVELEYTPPGGALGAVVARLFGEEPSQQAADDLRRFKQLIETGEIARSDGSPMGSRAQNQLRQRDANPPDGADLASTRAEEVSA